MKNVFMIVHGLDVNKGGMTTAMLDRSKIFYDNKINADIVTFDYKQNYDEILNSLKKQGKMDKRTKMFNLFKYYKNKSSSKTIKYNKKLYNLVDDFIKNTIEIREDTKISRFFDTNKGLFFLFYCNLYFSFISISLLFNVKSTRGFPRIFTSAFNIPLKS